MVRLENVVDIRTNQFHSVAIVKERNVKWFTPIPVESEAEEPVEEVVENYEEADEADE